MSTAQRVESRVLVRDVFDRDLAPGTVIGSRSTSGALRRGADAESTLAVDHGALRVRHLEDPGWGRAALAYGPFPSAPGLVLSTLVLNGLATSQTHDLRRSRWDAVARWRRTFPAVQLRRPHLRDNLFAGWASELPATHAPEGAFGFLAHPNEDQLGAVSLRSPTARRCVLDGVQNVPTAYVLVTRDDGVMAYASSSEGVSGFGVHPQMRPVGMVEGVLPESVYATLHQAVLGEVHYRVDTRVFGVTVAMVPELAEWFATAHVAASLGAWTDGQTPTPTAGGEWWVSRCTPCGSAGVEAGTNAVAPSSLVRLSGARPQVGRIWSVGLRFRSPGPGVGWRLELSPDEARLVLDGPAGSDRVATAALEPASGPFALEVIDDGGVIRCNLDGQPLFEVHDRRHGEAVGVGICTPEDCRGLLDRFEAHPREVAMPDCLRHDMPWIPPARDSALEPVPVMEDSFEGPPGPPAPEWERLLGAGTFELTGDGALRVRADRSSPNPGRTVYGRAWSEPDVAEVEVTVIPPGGSRGEGHQGRSGICFWQDEDNHLVLNHFIDDTSVGVSISAFARLAGFEEMYAHDAVWSNVGRRIRFGEPFRMRAVFDGLRFQVWVDGGAVLYRALTDYRAEALSMEIRAVGLVANWEWGDDTGSCFREFAARGARAAR